MLEALRAQVANLAKVLGQQVDPQDIFQPIGFFGQHTNPDRAAKRRRIKAWGGRRQFLIAAKGLRRMRGGLVKARGG